MKKIFLGLVAMAAMLFSGANANAQSEFNKGDLAFNLDFNLGSTGLSESGATAGFSLLGEYGFMNVINEKGTVSAGLLLGAGFHGGDGWDFSRVRIGTRGTLHYSFIPQLDTYAGINFCFVDIEKVKYDYSDEYKDMLGDYEIGDVDDEVKETNFVSPALVAGCRYMFTSKFGVNVECSWDHFQHLAFGLTFKL